MVPHALKLYRCKGGENMLTRDQEELITLLIEGERITDIAKRLKVSRTSIYTWINKEDVQAELNRRRQELANQGNNYILRDIYTYIDNIKALAKDKSDKRVCLSANQYLLNRIYGNPTALIDDESNTDNGSVNENELEEQLKKFKNMRVVK